MNYQWRIAMGTSIKKHLIAYNEDWIYLMTSL